MVPAKIDVPVLLIFFCRPQTTAKVFEQIKIARPTKLFLYQDGARSDKLDDVEKVAACRRIVEDIDWTCEVHKFYQDTNVGCDPSEFIAQKWAFDIVDRCIVLEDDDVPSQSFFPYCAELLERYKNDERINMICGMNHLGTYTETPNSYFFTNSGPICGWASWRRVVETWQEHYDELDDAYLCKLLTEGYPDVGLAYYLNDARKKRSSGKAHYEAILGLNRFSQSRLCILPRQNLIKNIGLGVDSAHCTFRIDYLPKHLQGLFGLDTYELEFPLKHPRYVVNDVIYTRGMWRSLGRGLSLRERLVKRLQTIYYRWRWSITKGA